MKRAIHQFIAVGDGMRFRGTLLLGLDFLHRFEVFICWSEKTVKLLNQEIQLETEEDEIRLIEKEDASKKIEASHLQVVQIEEKEKSLITNESEGQGDFPGEVKQPDEGKHPQSHTGPKAGRIDPKETFMEGSCNSDDGEHSQSHTDPTAGGIGPQNTVISSQEMNKNRKEEKQCVYVEDGRKKEMRKETEGGGTTKADNEVIEGTEVWNAKYVTDPKCESFTNKGPKLEKDEQGLTDRKIFCQDNKDNAIEDQQNRREDSTTKVKLNEELQIPARCRAICAGKIEKQVQGDIILIETYQHQHQGLLTARTISYNQETIFAQIMNVSNQPIKLQKGEVIGIAQVIETTVKEIEQDHQVRSVQAEPAELEKLLTIINYPKQDPNMCKEFEKLIKEYYDIFRAPDQRLTCTTEVNHRIITENVPPISKRPYRVPFHRKEILDKEIQTLLDNDIIQESSSPWSAPVILLEKKRHPGEDPEFRLCIDYRELNKITKPDFFPLPILQETIDQLSGASLFSIMDMVSGYFQVELHPDYREISAFSTPTGHYEFKKDGHGS
ncbi:uncharacterized protein LOC135265308 [Tribolium castaneum]|uniref:uncharacterized protein LOC135265308 n=1 Tax=Tribolium castaneum TaxID=7070 RepID=UPI0030FE0D3D